MIVARVILAGVVVSLGSLLSFRIARSGTVNTTLPADLRIVAQSGVPASTSQLISRELTNVRPLIDADFRVRGRPLLIVRLYATHTAFSRALHRLEGVWPQGSQDTSGNVIHGVLPLGPLTAVLPHNLGHIYTEWVMDRLTGNRTDRQPNPAWLYDGIAEWEADRRSAPVACSIHGSYPLPLSSIASPAQWWATRAGIFGGLEYCEAKDAATRLIAHEGWDHIVQMLHETHNWRLFARAVLSHPLPAQVHSGLIAAP